MEGVKQKGNEDFNLPPNVEEIVFRWVHVEFRSPTNRSRQRAYEIPV